MKDCCGQTKNRTTRKKNKNDYNIKLGRVKTFQWRSETRIFFRIFRKKGTRLNVWAGMQISCQKFSRALLIPQF